MEYIFPFNSVPYGSKIIIYGASQVGQEYLWQLRETGYAEVVCLADVQAERYSEVDIKVCSPDRLKEFTCDFVVIAIKNKIFSEDAIKKIKEMGIPREKIICQIKTWPSLEVVRDCSNWVSRESLAFVLPKVVPVGVIVAGGIGDCLVRKRLLEELLSWDEKICVDVYTVPKRYDLIQKLLKDNPQVHRIVSNCTQLNYYKNEYAAALSFENDLDILQWSPKKFSSYPNLLQKMQQIEESVRTYGVLNKDILHSVDFQRAEKDGLNFYTAYNRYKAFNIKDWHTKLPLSPEGKLRCVELLSGVETYITLSVGCDTSVGHEAKAWPLEYWEKLAQLLHQKMPNLCIVQVDAKGTTKVAECDKYIIGESLDVAAYALKCAQLHIDNEGGLVHLASQLGTKCTVLFGPTPISYYGYKENINIQAGNCHNCYWLTGNFVSCYRRMKKPECMYSITPEMVMEKVEEYFKGAR